MAALYVTVSLHESQVTLCALKLGLVASLAFCSRCCCSCMPATVQSAALESLTSSTIIVSPCIVWCSIEAFIRPGAACLLILRAFNQNAQKVALSLEFKGLPFGMLQLPQLLLHPRNSTLSFCGVSYQPPHKCLLLPLQPSTWLSSSSCQLYAHGTLDAHHLLLSIRAGNLHVALRHNSSEVLSLLQGHATLHYETCSATQTTPEERFLFSTLAANRWVRQEDDSLAEALSNIEERRSHGLISESFHAEAPLLLASPL